MSDEPDGRERPPDRDEIERLLADALREGHRKVAGDGRIRDPEKEEVRIKWLKATAYAANVLRQLRESRELAEYDARLKRLERERGPTEPEGATGD